MFFQRDKPYDRAQALEAANKARAAGKTSKAISEYRKVLAHEPEDLVVHGRLAPLLLEAKDFEGARKSFQIAARGQVEKGFLDRGIALYHQALQAFPQSAGVWEEIARLQLAQGRRGEMTKVLMDGHVFFVRRREDWPTAIRMLREIVQVDPHHVRATLMLARLLRRSGERKQAVLLLDALAAVAPVRSARLVLRARFFTAPSFGALLAWLRAPKR